MLYKRTLHELIDLVDKGEVQAEDVYESVLDRINQKDKQINAYVTIFDEFEENPTGGILKNLPIAIKDNMHIEGKRTTCSSKILNNFIAIFDATAVKKLEENGAVFIGKTNLDEFAMGSSTETSYFGTTKNPWDTARIPGGSSGGSAAAVACGEAIAALGSDTGGSIRQPASFCGVVGLKPTYGRVSRYGLVAFASSLDQIGPITRDVEDAAILMNIISGHDEHDSTSAFVDVPDFTQYLNQDIKGMKIGFYDKTLQDCDSDVQKAMDESIKILKNLGCEIESVDLPSAKYAVSDYYIIAPAEASSNLARYDGVKYGFRADEYKDLKDMYLKTRSEGFGDEVKRRIMLGTYVLSSGYYDAYYLKAQKLRGLIKQDFDKAFEKFDCIISPTTPTEAFKVGEKADKPLQMYLSDIFTIPANLTAIPAISIPNGLSDNGLPLGLQIMANAFREDVIFKVASAFEKEFNLRDKLPLD
ncbi:Asp-tRNA(Asn)/Glu-tRNA(Gln) amidotransferase subunit GatA [Hippea maritima]|uniref:Glutamyl-tRNA(Gln) amidotransferase subunit A n=1 Tax=Hippea maritima (strain ATCC 700847 / DSM 10411 / MH2) TaxID=760142 RepID=F2LWT2_HIPMA|nr:Asp-tRNA(Asn)/Glu-tRNA(Gln) amidotransferase subunit GatA [Hippea maritima]AEA33060.1 Glutamyl-tRNA(Gln) amidotransferase subunit A [Hippea maritima DSM 10411]